MELHNPQRREAWLSLHGIDPIGQPAELIYAAWGGANFAQWTIPQASLRHEPGLCLIGDEICGPVQEMNLIAD